MLFPLPNPQNSSPIRAGDAFAPENSPDLPDTEQLIRRAFEQDTRQGCELLYRRYFAPLCSHAARFVYSREIAEDLVHDSFCQFYTDRIFDTITTSYRAYLYKMVRNRAYNYLKAEAGRHDDLVLAGSIPTGEQQQPDSVTQFEELYQDVARLIDELPRQRRTIYLMNRFEGKKYAEIAQELNLSPRTVEVQIRRASHALRAFLQQQWGLLILLYWL
jgi:RNA polymerase sigma-70 factor (family 1)